MSSTKRVSFWDPSVKADKARREDQNRKDVLTLTEMLRRHTCTHSVGLSIRDACKILDLEYSDRELRDMERNQ